MCLLVCDARFAEAKSSAIGIRSGRRILGEKFFNIKAGISSQFSRVQNDHFHMPRTKPFILEVPLVEPSDFAEFIVPQSASLPVTAESLLEFYPPTQLIQAFRRPNECPFLGSTANWVNG
jgi:hypothetical protein